jgi:8-oxo-dGTP diphosphatase
VLYDLAEIVDIDISELVFPFKKVNMKKIEVVAGIIYFKNKILCVQRPQNKLSYVSEKFEFPGGKIENGETQRDALKRELIEELNISSDIKSLFLTVFHQYPDFELTMHSFICEVQTMDLSLNEHIASKWLTKNELKTLDWAAADLPIVNKLMQDE